MKKFSLFVLILGFLIITGCLIKRDVYHKSVMDCRYNTVVDGKEKESKILLFFDDENELIKYDYSSKTIYDAIDYSHYKGLDEESKRDFTFDDAEHSITYKKSVVAPFTLSSDINADHPLKYDEVKEYYLNKAYTCDKEVSKQINLKEIVTSKNPYIFIDERIYFNDPYNYNYLTSTKADGTDKKVFVSENVHILFGLGKYIYVKKIDSTVTTYAKINVEDNKDIVSLGDDIILDTKALYDELGRKNEVIKTSLPNSVGDEIISKQNPIYKNEFIISAKTKITYNNEDIYTGTKITGIALFRNFIYFLDFDKLVKIDLETKKIVDEKIIGQTNLLQFSYDKEGAVYATKNAIYKLSFEDFNFNKIVDLKESVIDINYSNYKLVYSVISASSPDLFDVTVLDTTSNTSNTYSDLINYQVSNNGVYVISIDGKISVKL